LTIRKKGAMARKKEKCSKEKEQQQKEERCIGQRLFHTLQFNREENNNLMKLQHSYKYLK